MSGDDDRDGLRSEKKMNRDRTDQADNVINWLND